jgi:hypothetical protein
MSSASVTNNFVNGAIGDADQVDQNFADLVAFCNTHLIHNHDISPTRVGVRLHKTASAIGSGGSPSAITWADEDQDTDGFWSAGTVVTIPAGKAGVYVLTFTTTGLISAGRAFVEIDLTSSLAHPSLAYRVPMDATEDRGIITLVTPLAVGDNFVCNVFHSSGASVTFESWLSAYRISA